MTEVDEATTQDTEQPASAAPDPESPPPKGDAESVAPPLNADGRERPGFLLEFPEDPELQRLVRAFEAGNYEAVRRGAPRLADATEDPKVRGAARELRRRIDPDPLMKYLLWVAIALFVFVVWYTYANHSR
ncbi:MAG TPA: hypothetical protein VK745_03440 [Polyangiaceae bacterium]|jgi:hypothetical protein|nr:hypothetical protein [Polyangiaceae bacterium]